MHRILFVCLGNICRSPTAEGVVRHFAAERGLTVELASCGTGGWHAGEGADERTVRHARRRGYDLSSHRARALVDADFERYDRLLAMDNANLRELRRRCPAGLAHKLSLFLDEDPTLPLREVPDPWSGGPEGFEQVLDLVETAGRALVQKLAQARAG